MSQFNDRRTFIKKSAAMGLVGSATMLHGFAIKSALAAQSGGYKALVCVNFKGGMDHADTIIPTDQISYDQLLKARGELLESYSDGLGNSSRHRDQLLSLNAINAESFGGRTFGLPKELSGIHNLFEQSEASIVANVGPLIEPTDRISMNAGGLLPDRLFSHNDQQSTWQSMSTEGARYGWGGGFLDAALASNPTSNALFAAITASNNDTFLAGTQARQFRLPLGSSSGGLDIVTKTKLLGRNKRFDTARSLFADFLNTPDGSQANLLRQDVGGGVARGLHNLSQYNEARKLTVPLTTQFPVSGLSEQLAAVAETISLRDVLGVPRQVFYVTLSGFDTHTDQATRLPEKHQELSDALVAFRNAMVELDIWNDVTVFTMSDFGRTLTDNGNGTDHGWGSHQFVFGGDVRGQRIFGDIPEADPDSNRFTATRARMIPTLSVEQYASSLGQWFGLETDELGRLFPNLSRFNRQELQLLQV